MDFSVIPYQLNSSITGFRRELLYLGTTYYERLLVFEHLNPLISEVLGLPVSKVELYFRGEKLIAISALLNVSPDNEQRIMNLLEEFTNKKAKVFGRDGLFSSIRNSVYYWRDNHLKLALQLDINEGKPMLVFSLNDFELFCWD